MGCRSMSQVRYEICVGVAVATLYDFYEDVRNLVRIHPPEMRLEVVNPDASTEVGSIVQLRLRMPPLPVVVKWDSVIVAVNPGHYFIDEQVRGPFRRWRHEHRFEEIDAEASRLVDLIDYDLIGGVMEVVGERLVRARLDWMFSYRHKMTRTVLESGRRTD